MAASGSRIAFESPPEGALAVESLGGLMAALGAGDFERLLGTPESEWLDFKQAPYLPLHSKKAELAKDVAQFANTSGGVLVIGYETERREGSLVEVAKAIRPVRTNLVEVAQYRDIIQSWAIPLVRAIRFQWFYPGADAVEGVLVIEISPQDESHKYFIVKRLADAGGNPADAIGVPVREGDRTVWLPAEGVQDLIRDGLRFRRSAPPAHPSLAPNWGRVLAELEATELWGQGATLYLQAVPQDPVALDLFRQNGLRDLITAPPALRPQGFGIVAHVQAEIRGESLVASGGRKLLRLDPDGVVTAAAVANPDFLGWAINEGVPMIDGRVRINSIVLTEFMLEFFRFVEESLATAISRRAWRFRVVAKRFQSARLSLEPGVTRRNRSSLELPRMTEKDDWSSEFEGTGDPESDAFSALARLYLGLFDFQPEAIPFQMNGRISTQQFLRLMDEINRGP